MTTCATLRTCGSGRLAIFVGLAMLLVARPVLAQQERMARNVPTSPGAGFAQGTAVGQENGPLQGNLSQASNGFAQPNNFPPAQAANTNTGRLPLAPPSASGQRQTGSNVADRATARRSSSTPSLITLFMSLLVVVGLFLAVVWLLRRGLPPGAHLLPREVVEVLGRTPLAGRQQAHLLRIGNKLVLVSVTPGGADTLTEVTDPLEVDRLAGLCRAAQPQSSTDAFQRILQQFAREKPAPGFFGTLVPSRPTEVAARVQPALEDDDDV